MSEETPIPVEVQVWWKNPTLWANAIAVVTMVLTQFCGVNVDPKLAAGILAIINILIQSPRMASTAARAAKHNKAIRERMVK